MSAEREAAGQTHARVLARHKRLPFRSEELANRPDSGHVDRILGDYYILQPGASPWSRANLRAYADRVFLSKAGQVPVKAAGAHGDHLADGRGRQDLADRLHGGRPQGPPGPLVAVTKRVAVIPRPHRPDHQVRDEGKSIHGNADRGPGGPHVVLAGADNCGRDPAVAQKFLNASYCGLQQVWARGGDAYCTDRRSKRDQFSGRGPRYRLSDD